ncbi:MAG: hypothetical protein JXQ69_06240 [Paludibacteraceae bacterium]|nr:hypothetical protein [Paludibacteraceae bacterium]MBN2787909.1 hypothetical protein [Paludibacteraceae bacterium]
MKRISYLLLAVLLFLAYSCKDEEEDTNAISTSEAAELTAAAIASNSGGASGFVQASATASATDTDNDLRSASYQKILADSTFSDSGTISSTSSGVIGTWNYWWKYKHELFVVGDVLLSTIKSDFEYNGAVDLPKYSSSHNGVGHFEYTDLLTGSLVLDTIWTLNGTFTRNGEHTFKTTAKKINSTTDIKFQDCEVSTDGSRNIVSGQAFVTIKGTTSDNRAFEYNGTVTFLGDSNATINIDGDVYTVDITTGLVN